MLSLLLLLCTAQADGLHAGVPTQGIKGFGPASFQTVQTGWSAIVLDGFVRVYVGKTEADASAWVARVKQTLRREKPKPNPAAFTGLGATEVHGNGTKLILFRDGNIGICVQHKTNARPWASKAHQAITEAGPPWPAGATLSSDGETWAVNTPTGTAQLAFEGGRLVPGAGLRFSAPPTALVVWDTLGRATRTEPKPAQSTAVAE
jgi:hypothetical protein